jgi:O-methyltransferase
MHDLTKIRQFIQTSAKAVGLNFIITGHRKSITLHQGFPKEMDVEFESLYNRCRPYTMTSLERMYSLYQSTLYCIKANIPGDFVECGVWRGGSTMLIALILNKLNITNRKIYLYDTFTGMTKPTGYDKRISDGRLATKVWKSKQKETHNEYAYASLSEVRNNMKKTNFPHDNLVFVEGKVEDTIPTIAPKQMALLRLDTDWYESTRHELEHLYPILSDKGVLILDDYGHFTGAKKAVDEYFSAIASPILLHRIDYTGRTGIK